MMFVRVDRCAGPATANEADEANRAILLSQRRRAAFKCPRDCLRPLRTEQTRKLEAWPCHRS